MTHRLRWLALSFVLVSCTEYDLGGRYVGLSLPTDTTNTIRISSEQQSVKGGAPACPRASEWELLTWPELDAVSTDETEPMRGGEGECFFTITPTSALVDRWYALHWTASDLARYERATARQLHDGTWVWPFHAIQSARFGTFEMFAIEGHTLVQAAATEPIDAAPGGSFGAMLTVTQEDASCIYPGPVLHAGLATIDFDGIPVVDCVRVDWNLPVHIHAEGAVTHAPPHAPVPVVDLDHVFGTEGAFALTPSETPPDCTDPRCQ